MIAIGLLFVRMLCDWPWRFFVSFRWRDRDGEGDQIENDAGALHQPTEGRVVFPA
jgi:hypothetical protein